MQNLLLAIRLANSIKIIEVMDSKGEKIETISEIPVNQAIEVVSMAWTGRLKFILVQHIENIHSYY